jgi:hypothetical protein
MILRVNAMKISALALIMFFCSNGNGFSEEKNSQGFTIGPGMEIKKIADVNLLVPIGTQVRQEGSLIVVETTGEYAARKFIDIDSRFKGLEYRQQTLEDRLSVIERNEGMKDTLTSKEEAGVLKTK